MSVTIFNGDLYSDVMTSISPSPPKVVPKPPPPKPLSDWEQSRIEQEKERQKRWLDYQRSILEQSVKRREITEEEKQAQFIDRMGSIIAEDCNVISDIERAVAEKEALDKLRAGTLYDSWNQDVFIPIRDQVWEAVESDPHWIVQTDRLHSQRCPNHAQGIARDFESHSGSVGSSSPSQTHIRYRPIPKHKHPIYGIEAENLYERQFMKQAGRTGTASFRRPSRGSVSSSSPDPSQQLDSCRTSSEEEPFPAPRGSSSQRFSPSSSRRAVLSPKRPSTTSSCSSNTSGHRSLSSARWTPPTTSRSLTRPKTQGAQPGVAPHFPLPVDGTAPLDPPLLSTFSPRLPADTDRTRLWVDASTSHGKENALLRRPSSVPRVLYSQRTCPVPSLPESPPDSPLPSSHIHPTPHLLPPSTSLTCTSFSSSTSPSLNPASSSSSSVATSHHHRVTPFSVHSFHCPCQPTTKSSADSSRYRGTSFISTSSPTNSSSSSYSSSSTPPSLSASFHFPRASVSRSLKDTTCSSLSVQTARSLSLPHTSRTLRTTRTLLGDKRESKEEFTDPSLFSQTEPHSLSPYLHRIISSAESPRTSFSRTTFSPMHFPPPSSPSHSARPRPPLPSYASPPQPPSSTSSSSSSSSHTTRFSRTRPTPRTQKASFFTTTRTQPTSSSLSASQDFPQKTKAVSAHTSRVQDPNAPHFTTTVSVTMKTRSEILPEQWGTLTGSQLGSRSKEVEAKKRDPYLTKKFSDVIHFDAFNLQTGDTSSGLEHVRPSKRLFGEVQKDHFILA